MERREAEIKFTNVEEVNQKNRSGALSYGATGLALGYEAGAGISFDNGVFSRSSRSLYLVGFLWHVWY